MCLSLVTKTYKRPIKKERTAWKVFRGDAARGPLCFPHYGKYSAVQFDVWLPRVGTRRIMPHRGGKSYEPGFHVFASRRTASQYKTWSQVVVAVKVRGVRTIGRQRYSGKSLYTLVADELFIPAWRKGKR